MRCCRRWHLLPPQSRSSLERACEGRQRRNQRASLRKRPGEAAKHHKLLSGRSHSAPRSAHRLQLNDIHVQRSVTAQRWKTTRRLKFRSAFCTETREANPDLQVESVHPTTRCPWSSRSCQGIIPLHRAVRGDCPIRDATALPDEIPATVADRGAPSSKSPRGFAWAYGKILLKDALRGGDVLRLLAEVEVTSSDGITDEF